LKIRINDQDPIRLLDLGHALGRDGQTAVLLSHNLHFPEVTQAEDGTAKIRIRPIFDRPGEMHLTLESDGESWGTKTVTVVPAPPDAREANDLLYPELLGDREPRVGKDRGGPDPASLTWMQLIIKDNFGLTPPVTDEQIQQLRDQLPIIMKHPDWAEIAEMLVARLESHLHRDSITMRKDDNRVIRDEFAELPPLPDIVARCLRSKPTNPYVKAIQDGIRGPVNDLRLMDAQRRGEDIQEILKGMSKRQP
jgi:hypothetical protein